MQTTFMATFMQQRCDAANLNKFSFVPEGNLYSQSLPEYFNCFDVRTHSTFPDDLLQMNKEELRYIWLTIGIKQGSNLVKAKTEFIFESILPSLFRHFTKDRLWMKY